MNKSQYKRLGRFTKDGFYFVGVSPCCQKEVFYTQNQAQEFVTNCYTQPNKIKKLKNAIKKNDSPIPTLVVAGERL